MITRRILLTLTLLAALLPARAGSGPFRGVLGCEPLGLSLVIDLYGQRLTVPGDEALGEVAGYLADSRDSRKWIVVEAETRGEREALLTIVNDYGSEDLTATLTYLGEGRYRLRQERGSSIKVVRDRKFVKIPSTIELLDERVRIQKK